MSSGLLSSFLVALQASLAVLLTIGYGIITSRLNILKESPSRDISRMCVRLFFPALLITSVGSELHVDTSHRWSLWIPCSVWALVYTLSSLLLGWVLKRAFNFPSWTVATICFNDTTALPLLLIQSLNVAGILSQLMIDDDDSTSAALWRAKSYFLVSDIICNGLTFAVGPKLLDDEETPDQNGKKKSRATQNGRGPVSNTDEESRNTFGTMAIEREYDNETTSLLPDSVARHASRYKEEISAEGKRYWAKQPRSMQIFLDFLDEFLNPPIGPVVGVIVGVISPIHIAFFKNPRKGGFFKA